MFSCFPRPETHTHTHTRLLNFRRLMTLTHSQLYLDSQQRKSVRITEDATPKYRKKPFSFAARANPSCHRGNKNFTTLPNCLWNFRIEQLTCGKEPKMSNQGSKNGQQSELAERKLFKRERSGRVSKSGANVCSPLLGAYAGTTRETPPRLGLIQNTNGIYCKHCVDDILSLRMIKNGRDTCIKNVPRSASMQIHAQTCKHVFGIRT